MDKLRELAATRRHRLAPDMVGNARNQKPLTVVAYSLVWDKLQHSPRKAETPALAIPSGPGEFVEEPGPAVPAGFSKIERDPGWPRWLHVPAGIYVFQGSVYRVYQSQYGAHKWQCKVLNTSKAGLEVGEDRWAYTYGIIAKLRPEHAATAEQSRKFEEDYGISFCTACGAELENPESRELRIGPVCRSK
jgi:hypothetical protein